MSDTTEIQWANHTGGPFLGCSMVSPGCTNCYAKDLAETRLEPIFRKAYKAAGFEDWQTRPVWGDKAPRVLSKGFWNDARRINAQHAKAGTRGRWFPSMIDWLDKMPAGIIDQDGKQLEPVAVLADFLKLVYETPNLDWLLLTKRPENFQSRLAMVWDGFYQHMPVNAMLYGWNQKRLAPPNVWIGTSVEDQQRADERIPHLLNIQAKVRFLSVEPMLGPVDFRKVPRFNLCGSAGVEMLRNFWVIVGGESGTAARPCNIEWIGSIVAQCKTAGVPCFVKQLGSHSLTEKWPRCEREMGNFGRVENHQWKHPKGGDPAEWPEDLRVREFPKP